MAALLGQIRNGLHLAPRVLSPLHLATELENLAKDRGSSPFDLLTEGDVIQVQTMRAMLICTRFRSYFCASLSVSKFEGSATISASLGIRFGSRRFHAPVRLITTVSCSRRDRRRHTISADPTARHAER